MNSLPYQSCGVAVDICWTSKTGHPPEGSAVSHNGQLFLPWNNVLGTKVRINRVHLEILTDLVYRTLFEDVRMV